MTVNAKQASFPRKIRLPGDGSKAGRLIWNFVELQIPMSLGACICFLVSRLAAASSSYTTIYHPGTYLYGAADVLFLTTPVMAWMIFRGHGWRYSGGMMVSMITPVAAIAVLGEMAGYAYLLWLLIAGYPLMCLGMLVYMLYPRDHFTGQVTAWLTPKS